MKRIHFLCSIWFLAWLCAQLPFASAQADSWRVAPVSSLHKLTATAPGKLEPFEETPVQLRAVRGEWESFQVVITAGDEPLSLSLAATSLATSTGQFIAGENVKLFGENHVLVDKPSGNRRLEKLWWPDALIPLDAEPIEIAARESFVVWATIRVPADTAPGQYFGALDLVGNKAERELFVSLKVEKQTLPPPTLRANVALYYDVLRDWYAKAGGVFSDEEWKAQKQKYYDFLLDYRLNAYDLPVAWNSDEAAKYLLNPGVLSVRTPKLDSPDFAGALAALNKSGQMGKAYYYWIDEPDPARYEEVRATTHKLKAIDARLRHAVTAHPNLGLKDAAEIWCPNVGDFFGVGSLNFQTLARERTLGRETWWYTMAQPRAPYPTWLVDDDASSLRLYGWMMARWNVTGFVYSMVHGWGPEPLKNLRSFADTNGDGTLVYPAELVGGSGPLPSIRLMILRDAIEDYELLRSLSPKVRDAVVSHVVGSTPHNRIDREDDWTHGTYRDTLFDALGGIAVDAEKVRPIALPRWKVPSLTTTAAKDGALPTEDAHRVKTVFRRFAEENSGDKTQLWLAHDEKNLIVRMHAPRPKTASREWFAVELAPRLPTERWRFVVTASGKGVVEKHTREGHFQIENFAWKHDLKKGALWQLQMKIPLSVVQNAGEFRFNALHRVVDEKSGAVLLRRAFPDAGDATQMPIVTLVKAAVKQ